MNWPEKWGFITRLKDCAGKTIQEVFSVKMEWGCTWSHAYGIRFTDGSRAFVFGTDSNGMIPSPAEEEIEKCPIFAPEELGEYKAEKKRAQLRRQEEIRKQKLHELERLKKELGEK